jgi:hypothetical protein
VFTESNHAVPVAGARARRSAVAHRTTAVSQDAAVGRVQPLTRMGIWVLLVLAAAN